MNKVSTDRKLELIKNIRMQNQYDRQQIRNREHLLYGMDYTGSKSELYSLESAALEQQLPAYADKPHKETLFTSFRIRLALAVIIFGLFIFIDRTGITIQGQTSKNIHELINANMKIPDSLGNLFDF